MNAVSNAPDPERLRRSIEQLLPSGGRPATGTPQSTADGLTAVVGAAETILAVDCVGVLLLDEEETLRVVASSGPLAAALEHLQEDLQVGPGVDTVREQVTVVVVDFDADGRYPELAARLRDLEVTAVVSAPIWVNGGVAGNLNALRSAAHSWSPAEVSGVEAYAGVVATLLQMNAIVRRDRQELSDEEQGAR